MQGVFKVAYFSFIAALTATPVHLAAGNTQTRAVKILKTQVQPHIKCRDITGDDRIAKVSIVGLGMRSHAGIAAQMFRTLAEEGINIQMISTSEIKISVVIDEKYAELAVRVLHKAFELEQGQ